MVHLSAWLLLLASVNAGCPYALKAQLVDEQDDSRRLQELNCINKPPFQLATMYGTVDKAKTCITEASRILKSNWNNDVAGPCLRMSFHDAGTYEQFPVSAFGKPLQCGGANGSFKQEIEDGTATNFKSFPQQNGMQMCYDFLWGSNNLSQKIRAVPTCAKMSNADMIQLVGYIAVIKTGGVSCPFYPGRPDAKGYDNTNLLPPEDLDDSGLTANFDRYDFGKAFGHFGLDLKATIVTLSGAHTIGKARVTDKSPASFGLGALSSSPEEFDGSYFAEVVSVDGLKGRQGWFASDMHGLCDKFKNENSGKPFDPNDDLDKNICADQLSDFAGLYTQYSKNFLKNDDALFKNNFCKAFQAMGAIGLQFPPDYNDVANKIILS